MHLSKHQVGAVARCTLLMVAMYGSLQVGPILTLDPLGGALTGSPGDTVGWGFTLTSPDNYLVVTSAAYLTSTPLGVFTDFASAFNFIVVGPTPENSTVTQGFDSLALTGIGSYLIDTGAVDSSLSIGNIQLTYDLYAISPNDPLFDPGRDLLSSGGLLTANASVFVAAADAPEPSGHFFGVVCLLGLGVIRRLRRG